MLKSLSRPLVALVLLLAVSTQAAAERPPLEEMPHGFQIAFWLNQAALAFNEGDYADWARATEKLHALRPNNQDFMSHLVQAYARLGETSKAFEMMLTMQQQGLHQDWDEIDAVESLREHRLFGHLNELMTRAGEPFGRVEEFARLGADVRMPEAMTHDPDSGRFFVGTIGDGLILTSTDGSEWETFARAEDVDGLMAVFDLAVDAERGHLWAATAPVPQFSGFSSQRGQPAALLRFDLASGELLERVSVSPAEGSNPVIGSLVVAGDGTVFAADTRQPVLYRLTPGSAAMEPFFGHHNFSSLRGLALSEDGSKLYVADYEVGILVIGTDEQQAWKLHVPENLNEGGIDGLYWWDGHLVAIQNGISPQRVLRLQLGPDGLGVINVTPVVAGLEAFDTPTFGTMVDSELVFFAVSHWGHVDSRGAPLADALPEVPLLRTDIGSPELLSVGSEMVDELQRRQEN
ncbi:MAG: hypothetical protein ACXIUL_01440 [Wenzhouxiangella sp.]